MSPFPVSNPPNPKTNKALGQTNRGGVGCGVGQGGVGREDRGQLACRDPLPLDGGDGGLAIVQDVPGDGRLK